MQKKKKKSRLSTIKVIEKAKAVHGNKYNYNKLNYTGYHNKLTIICPEHGEFYQTLSNHIHGKKGCVKCANDKIGDRYRFTTEQFIEKAYKIHSNKYDYSLVEYLGNDVKVKIVCNNHGIFNQTPHDHLSGKGCVLCYRERQNNDKRYNKDDFINTAMIVHGFKYNYSNANYINNKTKLEIICNIHGSFWMKPNVHIQSKANCPKCITASKGEELIKIILEKNNIDYVPQYRIPDKRYKRLRYDFYLPTHNLIIEFHGEQHYKPIKHFGGVENYRHIVKRDLFKNSILKLLGHKVLYFSYKFLKLSVIEFERVLVTYITLSSIPKETHFKEPVYAKN